MGLCGSGQRVNTRQEQSMTAIASYQAFEQRLTQTSTDKKKKALCEEVKKIFYAIMRKDRWDNIVVHFDDMKLGDQGTIAAAECLKRNERVEEMSLRRCAVGQMGAGEVAKSLKYNDKLFILDLSENEITMAGISTVCKHLTENNNVASFSISQCKLTDRGAKSVSFLMLAERKIRKLDISNNEITEKGFGQLAMAMRINTKIIDLDMTGNPGMENTKLVDDINKKLERNQVVAAAIEHMIDIATDYKSVQEYRLNGGVMKEPFEIGYTYPFDLDEDALWKEELKSIPEGATIGGRLFSYAESETIGRRARMEDVVLNKVCFRGNKDEHIFAIFDGHGGVHCSRFVGNFYCETFAKCLDDGLDPEKATHECFKRLNDLCHKYEIPNGTCCLVCYIKGNKMWTASAGDSRAVIARGNDENNEMEAIQLSFVWKPNLPEETKRIQDLGGFVTHNGRVGGVLAVSRALGDIEIQPYVSWEPSCDLHEITDDDEYIILGCDGLWDIFSNEQAVDKIAEIRTPSSSSSILRDAAYHGGSQDNISVVTVHMKLSPAQLKRKKELPMPEVRDSLQEMMVTIMEKKEEEMENERRWRAKAAERAARGESW